MLGTIGGTEPPAATAVDPHSAADRSMQVLEYVVALVAAIAAVGLTFLR